MPHAVSIQIMDRGYQGVLTPQQFADRWAKSTLSERSGSQQHFIDLCRMLGQQTPAEADPDGSFYTFEKGVKKSGGEGAGKGFADVWYRGRFAFEYKGKHKDLDAAYRQLQLYREDLENPPLLVVCDMERYEVHTNFTNAVAKVYSFTNEDIPKPETQKILGALFTDPSSLRPGRTPESVTEEVAAKFAQIADGLRERNEDPEQAAHFLNKLLFCLFAEDIGLLPKGLFTKLVERSRKKPEQFTRYAAELFAAMAEGGEFALEDVPHFNGGLFTGGEALHLEPKELRVLLEAARLDWGSVEPAIFGTLFERSMDPSQRARLGAHYTSREDILAIVEPVLMAPLRREWESVQEEVRDLAEKMAEQGSRARGNTLKKMEEKLSSFATKIRDTKVLDPACGSGNFLYVSLRQLLNLEKEVSAFAGSVGLTPFFPGVSPEQLHGIETSPYAHELAQVSIWIGYLQWMVDNGFGRPSEPILGPMTNILHMDAIMTRENGQVREPEWPKADVILGNPPFLGDKKMREELGHGYVEDLRALYGGRVPGGADLVTYWFERTRVDIEKEGVRRAGLLATNSIRGGANRKILDCIRRTGGIFFAESDRPWILEGAAVRVSMVGFDDGSEEMRTLDGAPVDAIYADLTGTLDLSAAHRLRENADIVFIGGMKKGSFDLTGAAAQKMLELPSNPNGRPNSDVIRPWINGLDVTRRPRGMKIIDFGVDTPEEKAALYEAPFEYVLQLVKPERDKVRNHLERDRWWLHARPAPDLRVAIKGLPHYIATARVAKHRLFVFVDEGTLPDGQIVAFARQNHYFFGVLHSRAHELWSLRMGTSLEDRPRYTPTTCFETFPLPWPPGEEPEGDPHVEAIADAARRLDELRRNWLDPEDISEAELKKRTLTNLYNARPTWLNNAHEKLNEAVFEAYGWPVDLPDEEILTNLLRLNQKRAGEDSIQ